MKLKELQTIDAEELASQPLPPPSFIVDGLIPYGLCTSPKDFPSGREKRSNAMCCISVWKIPTLASSEGCTG